MSFQGNFSVHEDLRRL